MDADIFSSGGIITSQPVNWLHPLNRGLVSWWLALPGINGQSFTWRDLCGRNHATLTNMDPATDWVSARRPGGFGALDLDNTDDSVDTGQTFGGVTSFTWTAWVYPRRITGSDPTMWGAWSGTLAYLIRFNSSAFQAFIHTGVQHGGSLGITPTTNTWQFFGVTYDGVNLRGYRNAVIGTITPAASGTINTPTENVKIGEGAGTSQDPLDGMIDDVRFATGVVWSQEDIARYYRISQSGYHGILNRMPSWIPQQSAAAAPATGVSHLTLLGVG